MCLRDETASYMDRRNICSFVRNPLFDLNYFKFFEHTVFVNIYKYVFQKDVFFIHSQQLLNPYPPYTNHPLTLNRQNDEARTMLLRTISTQAHTIYGCCPY